MAQLVFFYRYLVGLFPSTVSNVLFQSKKTEPEAIDKPSKNAIQSKAAGIGFGGSLTGSGVNLGSGVESNGQTAGIGSSLNWNHGVDWQSSAGLGGVSVLERRPFKLKNLKLRCMHLYPLSS